MTCNGATFRINYVIRKDSYSSTSSAEQDDSELAFRCAISGRQTEHNGDDNRIKNSIMGGWVSNSDTSVHWSRPETEKRPNGFIRVFERIYPNKYGRKSFFLENCTHTSAVSKGGDTDSGIQIKKLLLCFGEADWRMCSAVWKNMSKVALRRQKSMSDAESSMRSYEILPGTMFSTEHKNGSKLSRSIKKKNGR